MKTRSINVVVGVVIVAGIALGSLAATPPETVIARVNEIEILQADVDFIFATLVLPQLQQQLQGQELPEDQKVMIERNILDQLIVQKLILEEAFHLNIVADETKLQQQMESAKQMLPDADMVKLEKLVKDDLAIQQVIQDTVAAKVVVSDEDVQSYYDGRVDEYLEPEQVQASHILVTVEAEAEQAVKDAARQKIDDVLAKATAGEDFAELAKQFSDCPSKEQGGDLGFFSRGQMVPEFEEAAFAMNEGDISGVVETQFGYHIIKLTGKKPERQQPLEEVQEQIRETLTNDKTNASINTWIDGLRANATINIVGEEAAGSGDAAVGDAAVPAETAPAEASPAEGTEEKPATTETK